LLGVWIAPSQSDKPAIQEPGPFPSTAPYRIWDPINLLFNENNLGGGGEAGCEDDFNRMSSLEYLELYTHFPDTFTVL